MSLPPEQHYTSTAQTAKTSVATTQHHALVMEELMRTFKVLVGDWLLPKMHLDTLRMQAEETMSKRQHDPKARALKTLEDSLKLNAKKAMEEAKAAAAEYQKEVHETPFSQTAEQHHLDGKSLLSDFGDDAAALRHHVSEIADSSSEFIVTKPREKTTQLVLAAAAASQGGPKAHYSTSAISINQGTVADKQQKYREFLQANIFGDTAKKANFLSRIGVLPNMQVTNPSMLIDLIVKQMMKGHEICRIFKETISTLGNITNVHLVPNWRDFLNPSMLTTIVDDKMYSQVFRTTGRGGSNCSLA